MLKIVVQKTGNFVLCCLCGETFAILLAVVVVVILFLH